MFARLAILALLIPACQSEQLVDLRYFKAPADGQTWVSRDLPLMAYLGNYTPPEDYPHQPAFEVVDLATGELVPGTVEWQEHALLFVPEKGWQADTDYRWRLTLPGAPDSSPIREIPEEMTRWSRFSTADRTTVLSTSFSEYERTWCAVFSQPLRVDFTDEVQVAVTEAEIDADDLQLTNESTWVKPFPLLTEDPGLTLLCIGPDSSLVPEAELELQMFGETTEEILLTAPPPEDVILTLRHGNY